MARRAVSAIQARSLKAYAAKRPAGRLGTLGNGGWYLWLLFSASFSISNTYLVDGLIKRVGLLKGCFWLQLLYHSSIVLI